MKEDYKHISKFLSYILRHKPDAIGLELDAEGWASIQDILDKSDKNLTRQKIEQVVATSDKQRFTLSEDGRFIRANQGHSLNVDLGLQPVEPPEYLYHGTATRFLNSIMQQGLKPRSRQFVHLSADTDTAIKVGQRHGKPVILRLPAKAMYQNGHAFYLAKNGVWLTTLVPADNLQTIG